VQWEVLFTFGRANRVGGKIGLYMKVDYNNIGIGVLAIGSVLSISNELSLAKTSLIFSSLTLNA
jgi:hypothetical protein